MTNQEAVKIIQDRIDELVKDEKVQIKMMAFQRRGKSLEDIQQWVTGLAIATLYGADNMKGGAL